MSIAPLLVSPVVSTQWLADHLGAEKLVVLDSTVHIITSPVHGSAAPLHSSAAPLQGSATPVQGSAAPVHSFVSGHEEFVLTGHIPSAQFADLLESFSDPDARFPFTKPQRERFEAAAGELGIDNDTTVIVYDSEMGQWASRVWWLFRSWGYDHVAVLDGGLTKWRAEERETEIGNQTATPATFTARERPKLWVDKAYVERVTSGTESASLVCGSPLTDFSGEKPLRNRAGHIPGSISVPAARLVDRDTNALLPQEELREKFAPVLNDEHIVAYCRGGIAAASDALVLTILGHRNVALYDGSLNEWAADPQAELVLGA